VSLRHSGTIEPKEPDGTLPLVGRDGEGASTNIELPVTTKSS
jgi:hypothetical protein